MVAQGPLHSIGRLGLIIFCLGWVVVLALFVLPIYLDITAFKGPVEDILSDIVAAPVTVADLRLDLSLWPTLQLGNVEVQGSGALDAPLFTHIETAELRLSLLPLLRKELKIKHLSASDLDFHVHRRKGEAGNWPGRTTLPYNLSELANVNLEKVTIFLDDADIGQADAWIERLDLDIAEHRPLELALHGTLEGLPISLAASGPTLAALSPLAGDFPLAAHLEIADLLLKLSGSASREPDSTNLQLAVETASTNWDFLRVLEGVDIPEIGGFDIASRVTTRNSKIELSDLRGSLGSTTVHGALTLDTHPEKAQVSGKIGLGQVDLRPWLDRSQAEEIDASAPLPFDLLSWCDVSVEVSIDSVEVVDHTLDNLELTVGLDDGNLSLPLRLQLAGIPLSSELEIRREAESTALTAELSTRDLALDQLDDLLDLPEGLSGALGRIALSVSTSGLSIEALIANLDVLVEGREITLRSADPAGEGLLEVALENARVEHRTGKPLTLTTTGTLLEENFQLHLETAAAESLLGSDTWPLRVTFRSSGANIDASGRVLARQEGFDLDFDFSATGDRLGDLEAWLGFPREAGLPFHLSGHLQTVAGARSLRLQDSVVGRTQFEAAFSWDIDNLETPLVANLHMAALDLRELQTLADPITTLDTEKEALGFELPLLPSDRALGSAEVDLQIDRLYRDPVDLTDIQASLTLREGQLERSPFSFSYDNSDFEGELELDLKGNAPRFALDLRGQASEFPEVLEKEGLITDADLEASRLELSIAAEGGTVGQIVNSASISGKLMDVRWDIFLPHSGETLELRLGVVSLSGPPGEPIVLESEGRLGQEPIYLHIALREFGAAEPSPELRQPFRLQAGLASTQLVLEGQLALPIARDELDLKMALSAESLTDLSSLAGRDLPDLGPYHLQGRIASREDRIVLQDLDLTLGESDLQGSFEYRLVENRPTFDAKLTSRHTRSKDYFPWLHSDVPDDEEDAAQPGGFSVFRSAELSLDSLRRLDASIALGIDELDTGAGPIDHATLALELEDGRLSLLVQRSQEADTVAQIAAHIEPMSRGVDADLRVQWERQPYGLLADIINPGTASGNWSLDLALRAQGASVQELMQSLNGHIDFTDFPTDFDATILDLWGGGFLQSLLPVFNLGAESQINCTVGRFVVDAGVIRPDSLVLDATRSRVLMRGYLDLPNNYLELRLKPRPKKPSLISLATPVKIRGPLNDPSIGFATSGIVVTAFRLSLWVYTAWMDLLRKPLPKDGRDICLDPAPRLP